MKKRNLIIGIFALTILFGATISQAWAYQGNITQKGPNYTPEKETLIQETMNNNDYSAWVEVMEDNSRGRITEKVTAENFATFVQMHEAKLAGDEEKFSALQAELGLGQRDDSGRGNGSRNGNGHGHGYGHQNQNCLLNE